MGAGASSSSAYAISSKWQIDNSLEVVDLMMPVYFIKEDVTDDEIKLAQRVWDMVLQDASPEYLIQLQKTGKSKAEFPCIIWFYDTFYSRLFDVHPVIFEPFIISCIYYI